MNDIARYDAWLDDLGPAAVVIRQPLAPVEGADGVLFPATFAAAEDKTKFAGGYNIDVFPDGKSVCLVDSVGSQANRIEPIFAKPGYSELVPQVLIRAGHLVNLLDAGHRAGDAIVRCSHGLNEAVQAAFKEAGRGNAESLAKIAPTSLVFGAWNSRGEKGYQAKLPRLVASTIRAYDVRRLSRSAQYNPATEYVEHKLLAEPGDKKTADAYAERGFVHVPASASHGGVIATGGVRRDATLSLAALRLLAVREADGTLSPDRTQALRRYILGLSLVALTAPQSAYLRQGCNLVPDLDQPGEFKLVHGNGRREDLTLTHDEALAYARVAATAFAVGPGGTFDFDTKAAAAETGAAAEKVKGKVGEVDAAARAFKLKPGRGKPDVEVGTTDATVYAKGDAESTFDAVVATGNTVEVEMVGGSAAKVKAVAR
ncbi:MAG: type I-U CRISPR-associated protein Cas7 [Gemmataceae bacterium]|nr:type I-U CRISPR-associated protein Cas7 [Gemmataceae bacterium]